MKRLNRNLRTLSLHHSTTKKFQGHSVCYDPPPTTLECPSGAKLEEESNTRLSLPNSNPRSKILTTTILDEQNNLLNHPNIHAFNEDLSRRWLPGIDPIRDTVPATSLLMTPTRPSSTNI